MIQRAALERLYWYSLSNLNSLFTKKFSQSVRILGDSGGESKPGPMRVRPLSHYILVQAAGLSSKVQKKLEKLSVLPSTQPKQVASYPTDVPRS
jgi:hypothetical protein